MSSGRRLPQGNPFPEGEPLFAPCDSVVAPARKIGFDRRRHFLISSICVALPS